MGAYSGSNQWVASIYQFEQTDPVQGGPTGIDNVPLQNLADRTTYLLNQLGNVLNLAGSVTKTGNSSITSGDAGNLIVAIGTGVNTLTIASASTFRAGTIIPISSYCNANCVINVVGTGGQPFYDLSGYRNTMYMHNREHLVLVALTDHFNVLSASGNFYTAGEELKARRTMNNTIALQGQLLQRNQYPRLWEYISSLTVGQEVTSESTYFYDALSYRGLFTTGDGSSTFRLPDERGLFERMLDLGRGIDYGRLSSAAGGYENEMVGTHDHVTHGKGLIPGGGTAWYLSVTSGGRYSGGGGDSFGGRTGSPDASMRTGDNSGSETRPKNVGKLNLIRF